MRGEPSVVWDVLRSGRVHHNPSWLALVTANAFCVSTSGSRPSAMGASHVVAMISTTIAHARAGIVGEIMMRGPTARRLGRIQKHLRIARRLAKSIQVREERTEMSQPDHARGCARGSASTSKRKRKAKDRGCLPSSGRCHAPTSEGHAPALLGRRGPGASHCGDRLGGRGRRRRRGVVGGPAGDRPSHRAGMSSSTAGDIWESCFPLYLWQTKRRRSSDTSVASAVAWQRQRYSGNEHPHPTTTQTKLYMLHFRCPGRRYPYLYGHPSGGAEVWWREGTIGLGRSDVPHLSKFADRGRHMSLAPKQVRDLRIWLPRNHEIPGDEEAWEWHELPRAFQTPRQGPSGPSSTAPPPPFQALPSLPGPPVRSATPLLLTFPTPPSKHSCP